MMAMISKAAQRVISTLSPRRPDAPSAAPDGSGTATQGIPLPTLPPDVERVLLSNKRFLLTFAVLVNSTLLSFSILHGYTPRIVWGTICVAALIPSLVSALRGRLDSSLDALGVFGMVGFAAMGPLVNGGLADPRALFGIAAIVFLTPATFGFHWATRTAVFAVVVTITGQLLAHYGLWQVLVVDESTARVPANVITAAVGSGVLIVGALLLWRSVRVFDVQLLKMLQSATRQKEQEAAFSATLRHQAEQLRRLNEELESRATAQRRVLSLLAHELRGPAAAIEMAMKDLSFSPAGDEVLVDSQSLLLGSTSHLLSVMDELRTVINPLQTVEVHAAPFPLNELRYELDRQMMTVFRDSSIELHVDWPALEDDSFFGDAYRVRSIMSNLLRIAAQSDKEVRIDLRVRCEPIDRENAELAFQLKCDKGDCGAGSSSNDPSETLQGELLTGVSLPIVRRWVGLLGGEMEGPTAYEGGGGYMQVRIPLKRPYILQEKTAAVDAESRLDAVLKGKTLLLVEDDAFLRKLTVNALKKAYGTEVLTAKNGQMALEVFERAQPDLIITDYFMPVMDGANMIRSLRRAGSTVPIVAVTAATIGSEQSELRDAGADAVLSKPIELDKLKTALVQLMQQGRLLPSTAAVS